MYSQHFGLAKSPFRITPDPEMFYPGGNRGAVLDALVYAVSRGEGIVKVVGEVGSGKTMLCRMLERELPDHCEIIYLANPRLAPDEILHAIAVELELPLAPSATRVEALRALHDYLLGRHAANRRVVMFVEEAQGMPLATLEEIRMLSNLETSQDKLLQIVLFGQPELDAKLARHEIRQLNERITFRFELAPFRTAEIRDYLNTRLRASGYRGPTLFTAWAIRSLAGHSRGLLRRINVLADKALLAAFAANARRVTAAHVRLAARDSGFASAARWRPALLAASLVVLALAGVLLSTRIVAWNGPVLPFGVGFQPPSYEEFTRLTTLIAEHDDAPAPGLELPDEDDPRMDLLRLDGLDAVRSLHPVEAEGL
jgi:type II secretory pathway predicted ATPase ExeA